MAYSPIIPKILELIVQGEWKRPTTLNKIQKPTIASGNKISI